ncbi:MAG: hypothetical protein DDT19_01764 [Syntrophomonadaceae bacterium]|nr:hypothetical protein [Bacillota bacterium]
MDKWQRTVDPYGEWDELEHERKTVEWEHEIDEGGDI